MEKRTERRCIGIASFMILAGLLLLLQKEAVLSDKIAVVSVLPERIGDYTAGDIFYCQNVNCAVMISSSAVGDEHVCPKCKGSLDALSIGEKHMLTQDTIVLKKEYVSTSGRKIIVTAVTSGKEQKSIHRPQQCLPAHGYVIEENKVLKVSLDGGGQLDVMLLNAGRNWEELGGSKVRHHAGFAYWFVGAGRETPYHLQRLLWMSLDRVLKNTSSRWSYISVMVEREEGSDDHEEVVSNFISELYPLVIKQDKGR